jgi:hypothetical protein
VSQPGSDRVHAVGIDFPISTRTIFIVVGMLANSNSIWDVHVAACQSLKTVMIGLQVVGGFAIEKNIVKIVEV